MFLSCGLYGQQVEQYSLGLLNPSIRNPAAIGTFESLRAVGIVRQQWIGFSDSPSGKYLSVDMPVGMFSGGVGIAFQQNVLGAHKVQRLKLGYSYQKSMTDNSFIAIGMAVGAWRTEYDGSRLRTPGGEYGNGQINHQDPLLKGISFMGNTYTIDVGLYGRFQELGVGLSIDNALAGKLEVENVAIDLGRHYSAQVDYVFDISQMISVKSSVQVYANSAQIQGRGLLMGTWNDVYSVGITYRGLGKESLGGLIGARLNEHFQLFYIYEHNILPMRTVFDATHEVGLVYTLNKPLGQGSLPKIIYNPRYF